MLVLSLIGNVRLTWIVIRYQGETKEGELKVSTEFSSDVRKVTVSELVSKSKPGGDKRIS